MQPLNALWIPACAGMTRGGACEGMTRGEACASMTRGEARAEMTRGDRVKLGDDFACTSFGRERSPSRLKPLLQTVAHAGAMSAIIGSIALGTSGLAHAQSSTIPGPAPEAQGLPAVSAPSATFRLNDVRFSGAQTVDTAELRELAQPYIGREVAMADLEKLAASVTARYRERGFFLAQAIVPVQTVQGGVVEISVIEGRLGKVDVQVAPDAPISAERVRGFLEPLKVGEAVNAQAYERAMLLLSDQPGIRVSSGLQQGAQPGTVDLAVEVVATRRFTGSVDADNHGTKESGRYRLGGSVRWASPAGIGDNLDARVMVSNGNNLQFGRVSYEAPLGTSGLRAGLGLARVQYQVGGEFEPLDARGHANVVDFSLNYPFIRQRGHNLLGRLSLEAKELKDEFRAVDLSIPKRVHALGVGWAWDRRDNIGGGGYFASSGTLYSGRLQIRDAGARAADAAGRQTEGGFTKLAFQVSRLQALAPRHSLYVSIGGQWASKNLDPSEKLALGGARAVRAYPSSEALVDQGWISTVEYRWAVTDELTPFVFFDAAHGRRAKSAAEADNGISLRGAGLGLSWGRPGNFSVNATLAWRVGTDPAQTDGGGRNPRFFIQAQKVF